MLLALDELIFSLIEGALTGQDIGEIGQAGLVKTLVKPDGLTAGLGRQGEAGAGFLLPTKFNQGIFNLNEGTKDGLLVACQLFFLLGLTDLQGPA